MANPALLTCTYASLLAQLGVALLRGSQRPSPALLTRTCVDLGPPPGQRQPQTWAHQEGYEVEMEAGGACHGEGGGVREAREALVVCLCHAMVEEEHTRGWRGPCSCD